MCIQLAYQLREARLARTTIAELQRQLEEQHQKQKEMENRRNVQLSEEIVGAMRLLTDKVTRTPLYYFQKQKVVSKTTEKQQMDRQNSKKKVR